MELAKTKEQKRILKIKSILLKREHELMALSDNLKGDLEQLDLPDGIKQEDTFILCFTLADIIHADMTGLRIKQLPEKVFRLYGKIRLPLVDTLKVGDVSL